MSTDDQPQGEDDIFVVPIEDHLDLHFFARRDLPSVIDEYLLAAAEAGFVEVRLIHGRGKGVARAMVEKLLERSPHVERHAPAPPARGGAGATLVWLRAAQAPVKRE